MSEFDSLEEEYFGLAETWDEELYGKLRRDRAVALAVAGVSALLAAMAIGAVMMLTPLKTVEPYMVLVDKTTGYAEAVREMRHNETNSLTENEAIIIAEITRYIINRETADPMDTRARARDIQMSTSTSEYQAYVRRVRARLADLPPGSRREVSIRSVVPNPANKSATVRFSTQRVGTNSTSEPQYWIATLTYDFVALDIEMQFRYLNPLGFIVRDYRVDPETIR